MNDRSSLLLAAFEPQSILSDLPDDLPGLLITQRPPMGPTVSCCAVGDIGLSGRAAATAQRMGSDVLFAEVAPVLRAADISLGNLESPLASEIAPGNRFAAPITGAATLRDVGFNILHLANNHVGEFGQAGLVATLDAVRGVGLSALGAGDDATAARQMIRTDIGGVRIGWLGCGRTLLPQTKTGQNYWEFNEQELIDRVLAERSGVDVLIVSIHIGFMYMDYPRPQHKTMAERLMESGADLVLMHHAHVLQGVEITPPGKICCYNLGNFLYDWEEGDVQTPVVLRQQNEGGIFWFEVDRQGVARAAVLPTWIDRDCCVRWARGERGKEILSRLARISRDLDGDIELLFEQQRAERNTGPILKVLAFHIMHRNWGYIFDSLRRARLEHFKMLLCWLLRLGTAKKEYNS